MKRAVITGMGIVSSLGNTTEEVTISLKEGQSGIKYQDSYEQMGLRSRVAGSVNIDLDGEIDRKLKRFMGDAAAYAYISMRDAIADAGLTEDQVSSTRSGLVAGSGGASSFNQVEAADTLREKGVKRMGPYRVTRIMGSTVSACLATPFKIKGVNYSITSACSTSAHCIGHALELIQLGKQDIVFAGGGEEEHWSMTSLFDAMGALSTSYNDRPEKASRAFDRDRDGFVIAGGGGCVVVEELEHALARGAKIYAEIVGYGATSDGYDMVAPSGDGAVRAMQIALSTLDGGVDYINAHGTSTPAGDLPELKAIQTVFGQAGTHNSTHMSTRVPAISSTKSLAGHSLGATGVQEVIFSLLMMENDFICASANIDNLDPDAEGMPIVLKRIDNAGLKTLMSNSFGFGGTNAVLILQKPDL